MERVRGKRRARGVFRLPCATAPPLRRVLLHRPSSSPTAGAAAAPVVLPCRSCSSRGLEERVILRPPGHCLRPRHLTPAWLLCLHPLTRCSRSTPPARPDSAPSPPSPFLPWKPSLVESRDWTQRFFQGLGVGAPLPAPTELHGTYSALVRGVLSSSTVSASASPCISYTLRRSPSPSPPS
uniref:Uncharacterized protein n=1 Tax=Oryza nivara TaxID=4536 RepID=A0A0E0ISA8_ORYNI